MLDAAPDANAGTSVVTSLLIGAAETLDVNNNALIINYTGQVPRRFIPEVLGCGHDMCGVRRRAHNKWRPAHNKKETDSIACRPT